MIKPIDVEKFIYDRVFERMDEIKVPAEIYNLFESPLKLTLREFLSDYIAEEVAGKKFKIKPSEILLNESLLIGVYERTLKAAYKDFIKSDVFLTRNNYKNGTNHSAGSGANGGTNRKRGTLPDQNRKPDRVQKRLRKNKTRPR